MRERDKFEADEKRQRIFARDWFKCQHCGESILKNMTPQVAHRISKSKRRLKQYGPKVIHHSLNLVSVCSIGKCNDAFNIDNKPMEVFELVGKILEAIKRGEE